MGGDAEERCGRVKAQHGDHANSAKSGEGEGHATKHAVKKAAVTSRQRMNMTMASAKVREACVHRLNSCNNITPIVYSCLSLSFAKLSSCFRRIYPRLVASRSIALLFGLRATARVAEHCREVIRYYKRQPGSITSPPISEQFWQNCH